jgi:hypothetical protein
MTTRHVFTLILGLALLAALAGCSKKDNPVNAPAAGPSLSAIGAKSVSLGNTLAFDVTATDPDAVIPVLTTSTLPANATFVDHNNGTGSFSFIPASGQIGTAHVTFYATASSMIDSEVVAIAVDGNTATTVYDNAGGFWTAQIDASSYTTPAYYLFSKRDTVTHGVESWSFAGIRTDWKTNSGLSADLGGDVKGIGLTLTNFDAVTAADTVGKSWKSDGVAYFINNWYNYDPVHHTLDNNRNVYTMVDAGGHNYVKFRIDSLVGAAMPPDMGTVYLTYYYNPTADSKALTGSTASVVIPVGANTVYFDFSSGTVVTPADPKTSTDWDLVFSSYNVGQNSGPNGPAGKAAAFYVFDYMTDPTDIDAVTDVYNGQPPAPMFGDAPSSIFSPTASDTWYNYDGATHQLTSKNYVYLLKTGGKLYKMQIVSYYANVGGVPKSANYIFKWKEI